MDYLKYDWCCVDVMNGFECFVVFVKMCDVFVVIGWLIVYGILEYGEIKLWMWVGLVVNFWCIIGDIGFCWLFVFFIINF